jgi:hypothetical protein
MTWITWVGWACVALNAVGVGFHFLALRRFRRLNGTLLALCINAYALRQWPVMRSIGGVVGFKVQISPEMYGDRSEG